MSKRKKNIKVKQGHISYDYVEDDITHGTAGSWLLCEHSGKSNFQNKTNRKQNKFPKWICKNLARNLRQSSRKVLAGNLPFYTL